MKIWTNTEFKGRFPVGTSAVVIADTRQQACELLNQALTERGLEATATPEQFNRIVASKPGAYILVDGDY